MLIIFGLCCVEGCMIKGLQRGPDFYLRPSTIHPTPITRCMMLWACSTMMHSSLHTHFHSNTHTNMKATLHFNNNQTHSPFLPCKHNFLFFPQAFWARRKLAFWSSFFSINVICLNFEIDRLIGLHVNQANNLALGMPMLTKQKEQRMSADTCRQTSQCGCCGAVKTMNESAPPCDFWGGWWKS